ncbi:adhesin P30, partial [Mycoplasmoides pneumoniae]
MKLPPRRKLKLFLLAWMLVLFSALIVLATLILVQHNNTELTEVKSELSPLNVVLHAEEDTVQIQGKPITEQAWFIPTVAGCFGFSALAIILGLAIGLPIVKRKEKRLLEEKERQEQLAEQLQRISAQQEEQQALEQQAAAEAHAEAEVEPAPQPVPVPPQPQVQINFGPRTGFPPQPGMAPRPGMPPHPGMAPRPGFPPQPGMAPRPGMPPHPGMAPRPGFPPQP